MVFSSPAFLYVFLPVTMLLYFITPMPKGSPRLRNVTLLFMSLIFYAWGEPRYVFLMVIQCVFAWGFSLPIDRYKGEKAAKVLTALIPKTRNEKGKDTAGCRVLNRVLYWRTDKRMGKLVMVGGGECGRPGTSYETKAIDSEIIALTGKASPNFLFTALGNEDPKLYYKLMGGYTRLSLTVILMS